MSLENIKNEPIRVLFIINNLGRAGAERAFVNQMNYLYDNRQEVFLVTLLPEKENSLMEELKLPMSRRFFVGYQGIYDRQALLLLRDIIRENKIETVYATLEFASIVARLVKMLEPRIRVVRRESGTGEVGEDGKPSFKIWKFKILDMLLNFWADKIIVLSEEMRELAIKYQPWHRHKVEVVGNGVKLIDSENDILIRNKNKLSEKRWKLLAVASMDVKERAFEYIIDALSLIPRDQRDMYKLYFVGDGKLRVFYEERVRSRGVEYMVEFLGRLNTEDIIEKYRESHIFMLSSLSEGFPNVLLEAGSFGLPVITTRAGGAVDLVREAETGFFVPFKDAQSFVDRICWYKANPDKWFEMGLASYRRTKNFFAMDIIMEKIVTELKKTG